MPNFIAIHLTIRTVMAGLFFTVVPSDSLWSPAFYNKKARACCMPLPSFGYVVWVVVNLERRSYFLPPYCWSRLKMAESPILRMD